MTPPDPARFLEEALEASCRRARENVRWLGRHLHPYFFITMQDEPEALAALAAGLHTLAPGRRLILADEREKLIIADVSAPGTFYGSLRERAARPVRYVEATHSLRPLPGMKERLEVLRFEYETGDTPRPPAAGAAGKKRAAVRRALRRDYPGYAGDTFARDFDRLLEGNERYVRVSPPERIARLLWLYRQGRDHDGLFFDAEVTTDVARSPETRIVFAVGNPPRERFLPQVIEVFHRLGIAVRRAYCLVLRHGEVPYFLGTFYVRRGGRALRRGSRTWERLRSELYTTQILSPSSRPYRELVAAGTLTGDEAALVDAAAAFCYTTLAHAQPDRFHLDEVAAAFTANPAFTRLFCRLFRARFAPALKARERPFGRLLREAGKAVERYGTGHRHLDGVRRTVYRTALLFVRHTVKTNLYVPEKHALAFRLDPAYLARLDPVQSADLPAGTPFRVTFFSGRHGAGYHVGFADIARGGWRTVVCRDEDDYHENLETLFREVFVLAHTQHLKNKDIYEGGSKMVVVLDASGAAGETRRLQRLYKLQYGFINAFFDLFARRDGLRCHPAVVDHLGEEEAIELGPDENMRDEMIEYIAQQGVRRGYLLGAGVISGKRAGIGHREYGVTARGVVVFAGEALRHLGVDIARDRFTVKMTGGPAGDVAGNTIAQLVRCAPRARFLLVVDGTGVLFDPEGIDRRALARLVMRSDVEGFDAERLHEGGSLATWRETKRAGLRTLYCRRARRGGRTVRRWITADEMHRLREAAIFDVDADLFVPAGGRPETIGDENWRRMIGPGGAPRCRAIVEGANSFITPSARDRLQEAGVVLVRDASANKCGVIASSCEVIANLLFEEKEFLRHKERYVADVVRILEKRAGDEARLIFERVKGGAPGTTCTGVSEALSREINALYERLFSHLVFRPRLLQRPSFRRALVAHLPALIGEREAFRRRIRRLPLKYRCAMTAAELATAVVYGGGWQPDFEESLVRYVDGRFPPVKRKT